jgi:hypothetical protein
MPNSNSARRYLCLLQSGTWLVIPPRHNVSYPSRSCPWSSASARDVAYKLFAPDPHQMWYVYTARNSPLTSIPPLLSPVQSQSAPQTLQCLRYATSRQLYQRSRSPGFHPRSNPCTPTASLNSQYRHYIPSTTKYPRSLSL